jgi:hypothetical protein
MKSIILIWSLEITRHYSCFTELRNINPSPNFEAYQEHRQVLEPFEICELEASLPTYILAKYFGKVSKAAASSL